MKKIILLAAAFLLAATACSKDDPAGIQDGTYNPARKISKVYIETVLNGESWGKDLNQTWTWEGDRLVSILNAYDTEPVLFTYQGNRIASLSSENMQALFVYQGKELRRIDFSYDGQTGAFLEVLEHQGGYITRIRVSDVGVKGSLPEGAAERLGEAVMKFLFPTLPSDEPATRAVRPLLDDVRFEYEGGNVVRQIMTGYRDDGPATQTYTYTYDDQSNPYCSGMPAMVVEPFSASRNNPLSMESISRYNGETRFNASAYTYRYEGGFPVQANQYVAGESDYYQIAYYEYLN